MLLLFAVLGLVGVVIVALVAVGQVVGRLAPEPERQVFAHDEALAFVADALPDEVTATLSYDDVARIMRLNLDFLHAKGVARSGGDLTQSGGPVVVDPADAADAILERAARVGFRPARAHVEEVIAAQLAYFEAIGAVGEVVTPTIDDEATPSPG